MKRFAAICFLLFAVTVFSNVSYSADIPKNGTENLVYQPPGHCDLTLIYENNPVFAEENETKKTTCFDMQLAPVEVPGIARVCSPPTLIKAKHNYNAKSNEVKRNGRNPRDGLSCSGQKSNGGYKV